MKQIALKRYQGKAVARSAGVVVGRAQKLDQKHRFIREFNIEEAQVERELSRLQGAVQTSIEALKKETEQLSKLSQAGDLVPILEAHQMMVQDPELLDRACDFIRADRVNAEWALKKSVEHIVDMFALIKDAYLRSRKVDVEHVGQRILDVLVGENITQEYTASIMVAKDFSPSDVVAMWRAGVPGFISMQGGENSHAMIVARGVGLPGLAGVQGLFEHVEDGGELILDAEQGSWILHPNRQDIEAFTQRKVRLNQDRAHLQGYVGLPSTSADGYALPLMANIEFIEEVAIAVESGADGIGLFRTEFLFMQNTGFPDEDTQFSYYEQVAKGMKGKPITFRLLDVSADKLVGGEMLQTAFEGENPALGLRGVRMLLQHQDMLKSQLRAIVRTAKYADVSVLVPMVTVPSEMVEMRRALDDVCLALGCEQVIRLGCMIEVPAAVFVADELAEVSDFFSIGSNDLVQYSLAVDRTDDHVSHLYDVEHPAVIKLITMIVQAANQKGIPVAICGELAANAAWLERFVGMKISSLSMSARQILPMRKRLHQIRALS